MREQLVLEVKKENRRLTLRQLVTQFFDQGLPTVKPIWLCSPEAVASIFPLQPDLFDVVIFDEASQCPVETGLLCMARGRQVLIAGDDQQMPPSAFFRAAQWGDDDDDGEENGALLDSRSVLDVARNGRSKALVKTLEESGAR